MSVAFHRLKMRDVRRETADAVSIAFAVPPQLEENYRYDPGQHLTLRTMLDGAEVRRSYPWTVRVQVTERIPVAVVKGEDTTTLVDNTGRGYTTAELSVNIVRAATSASGPLRAIGTALHSGRQLATAEARIVGADGKLYAHGTTTCVVFEVPPR